MNLKSANVARDIAQALRSKMTLENDSEATIMAVIFGHTLGYRAMLPSEKVSNPISWYNESGHGGVMTALDGAAAATPINTDLAAKIARDIWLTRYAMLHDPLSPTSVQITMSVVADADPRYMRLSPHSIKIHEALATESDLLGMVNRLERTLS